MHSATIEEVFSSYRQVNVDLAENTLAHTGRCLSLFAGFLAARGRGMNVREVSRDDVADWRASMIVEKDPEGRPRFKPSTVNSYLKGAAPLFAWCMQRKEKLIDENPFCRVKYLAEDIPVYEYTREEVDALLEAADVRWKGMIVLACSSGLSRGECLNLTWSDIDCDTHQVTVQNKRDDPQAGTWEWRMKRRGKDRRPIKLPMSDKVGSIIMELRAGPLNVNQPYPFILSRRYWELRSQIGHLSRNVRNSPDSNFDSTFRSLCQQAGIEKGERDFHDLRKTFVTNLGRVPGMAPRDVQALARHASMKTTERYLAVNPAAFQMAKDHSFV